ncbi:hypothetical protein [Methylocystis parvus]|uniref:Uncharacterized protein n=1 Tax=Methylocystis parvus TaxID=134 RepID=A0A6B8MEI0_9HYPH|nr:hypothetical protein [Methylocystis parvus]QGM99959.1 hypothetical protein F7D14_20460 [Methylocystis parvus]WBK02188.1 hypothetical protein MMG94_20305 [Methylocystis parvus OBBP]
MTIIKHSRRAIVAGLPVAAGSAIVADPVIAAMAERERLEAIHITAVNTTDSLVFCGDESAIEAAEQAQSAACKTVCDFERKMKATIAPTTPAGAIALLRFVADDMDLFADQEIENRAAILSAIAVLERGASS